jgi:hypothetical protein
MPQSDNLPLCLPVDLSDEAAATLIEFLYELTEALESRYFVQLRRYHQEELSDQRDFGPAPEPTDPPF